MPTGHRFFAAYYEWASVRAERQGQAEGEHQPDDRQEGALDDPDRLPQRLHVHAQEAAGQVPDDHEPQNDRGDNQPELPGAQPEEHGRSISEQAVLDPR